MALKKDICESSFSSNRKIEFNLRQPQPAVRTNDSLEMASEAYFLLEFDLVV